MIKKVGWLPPPPDKWGRRKGWTKQQTKVELNADKILINVADVTTAASAFLNVENIVAIAAECIKEHAGDLMDFTKPLSRNRQTEIGYMAWQSAVKMLRHAGPEFVLREMRAYRGAYLVTEARLLLVMLLKLRAAKLVAEVATSEDTESVIKFSDHSS
jgi:hypothetical protein